MFYIYCIKQNKLIMGINKITLEDKFKINNVESTLKCLLQYATLEPHHKKWVVESYKNILDFKHQNDIL